MRRLGFFAILALSNACGSSGDANGCNPLDPSSCVGDGATTDGPDVSTCELAGLSCNPLADECAAEQGCYLKQGGSACAFAGPGVAGEACVYENDCDAGFACVQLLDGYACARLCATEPGCAKACKTVCPETYGRLTAYPGLGFCAKSSESRPCDLLTPDCPGSQACYYSSDGVACHAAASNLPVGSACGFANDCVAGAVCVNGACGKVCDTTSPQCPDLAPTCVELPDAGDAGVCLPEE